MPIEFRALVACLIVALSTTQAGAQKPQDFDALGCWQTEIRRVPRQGAFYAAFCFLKGGRISGSEMHGVSGSSIEDRWKRLDRWRVLMDGHECRLDRLEDGRKMLISGCPKYAREWVKADPAKVLPPDL